MIEKLIAIYLLLIAAHTWYIRHKYLFTIKRFIRLIAGWCGQMVFFDQRTRIIEKYLVTNNLKRIKVESYFDRDDYEGTYLQILPKDEQEKEKFFIFTRLAGEQFEEFLNNNPHLVNRVKMELPRYPREEFWHLDFWVHPEQELKFKQ